MHLTTGLPTFLYCFEQGDTRIVCPVIERTVGGWRDLATPPGISGFTGTQECEAFPAYWREFAAARRYVCAYIGLHPLFSRASYQDAAEQYNTIFVLDLALGIDELWKRLDRNRRRELRNWPGPGVDIVRERNVLTDFLVTHHEAFRRRVGASDRYALSDATLAGLAAAEEGLLIGASRAGRVEAVALFGRTPYAAEWHLNVSTPEGKAHTSGLLWQGVRELAELGVPALNLGGGLSEHDRIAESKRRYRARALPLRVLKEIYLPDVYAELCAAHGVNPADPGGYFPAYRSPGRRDITRPAAPP
jgi:hypothetical protein